MARIVIGCWGSHGDEAKCAAFLTSGGYDSLSACRVIADQLEVSVGDAYWPLPRCRDMLFPV